MQRPRNCPGPNPSARSFCCKKKKSCCWRICLEKDRAVDQKHPQDLFYPKTKLQGQKAFQTQQKMPRISNCHRSLRRELWSNQFGQWKPPLYQVLRYQKGFIRLRLKIQARAPILYLQTETANLQPKVLSLRLFTRLASATVEVKFSQMAHEMRDLHPPISQIPPPQSLTLGTMR